MVPCSSLRSSTAEGLCDVCGQKYVGFKCFHHHPFLGKEVNVNGQKLETVTNFKYLGSVTTDEGSKPEILSRIAQATAALARLKPVWNDKSISLTSKI